MKEQEPTPPKPTGVSGPKLEALIEFGRADLMCFAELVFPVLHPGKRLVYAEYLGVLASVLMDVEEGRYKNVLINLAPRHMKSMMVSVLYVAWRLGRDPTPKFITISYGDDLAHDLSALARTLMIYAFSRTQSWTSKPLTTSAQPRAATAMQPPSAATSLGSAPT